MDFALQPVIAVRISRRERSCILSWQAHVRNPGTGVHLLPRDQI